MIAIQPIGRLPRGVLSAARNEIKASFGECFTLKGIDLCSCNVEIILDSLKMIGRENQTKIVGLMNAELTAEWTSWLYGMAVRHQCCIVSVYRLKEMSDGGENLFFTRVQTEVRHELGHVFNLDHCWNEACSMAWSSNLKGVDRKAGGFCVYCRAQLEI